MRRIKLVLAALAVAVASFMAFAGPAMAVECEHTNKRGVIECGKHDNVFLSEDRFDNRLENDIDDLDDFDLNDVDVDDFEVDDFLFPLFVIDDIDCDGEDDDGDGLIDEDVQCVIELEPVEWWD